MAQLAKLPSRLHHNAYVTRDQEKTRQFYEDIIGLPLLATWCESDELFGKLRTYVHTFYGIGDGRGNDGVVASAVTRFFALAREQHLRHGLAARQAADVRRQDPVDASAHA